MATTPSSSCASSWGSTCGFAPETGFDAAIVDDRPNVVTLNVQGAKAAHIFRDEAGGHRWQRVPPNEKRGRVQTSTVTVAILAEPTTTQVPIRDEDLDWTATRGSGAGGQARNKTSSAVQLWHTPTGLMVRCESERSQAQNRATALSILRAKLWTSQQQAAARSHADDRRRQVGSGMRGDKRRTIRLQDGTVTDHPTGRTWRAKEYMRGDW